METSPGGRLRLSYYRIGIFPASIRSSSIGRSIIGRRRLEPRLWPSHWQDVHEKADLRSFPPRDYAGLGAIFVALPVSE